jgi:curved DNA-binding protein CbpA
MENPYAVLGIHRNASPEEVKKAYFGLIREHPPEREPQAFKRIRLAYDSLRDADKRSQTDIFLFDNPQGGFSIHAPKRRKYIPIIDLDLVIHSLSDLSRTDFSDDFREIEVEDVEEQHVIKKQGVKANR